jgi:hypothetical protein
MQTVLYESPTSCFILDDFHHCESFTDSYSCGNIDVGGIEPPEAARQEYPDIASSGDFQAPIPPDDEERVRELYAHSLLC